MHSGRAVDELWPVHRSVDDREKAHFSYRKSVKTTVKKHMFDPETSFAQESKKMYLEYRVASNPSVLVFGRLNQAPDQATTCSHCEKFAFQRLKGESANAWRCTWNVSSNCLHKEFCK